MEIDFDGNMTQEVDWQIGPAEEKDDNIVFQFRRRTPGTKLYCEVVLTKISGLTKAAYEEMAKERFQEILGTIQFCPVCASVDITNGASLPNTHTSEELEKNPIELTAKSFCCKDCGGLFVERYDVEGRLFDRTPDPISMSRANRA